MENCDNNEFITEDYSNSPYTSFKFDSNYTTVPNINNDSSLLSILSVNIQSLNAKFQEFKEFIASFPSMSSPDIICLQELWQFPNSAEFCIPGYSSLIYKLRKDGVSGGGIGIYVKNTINFLIDPVLSIFYDRILECLVIEISINDSDKILIGSIYRPPSHPTLNNNEHFEQFIDILSNLIETCNSRNIPTFLLGDFNLDILKYGQNKFATEYIDLLFSHGFIQTITKPTRCSSNSATLIDHCLTNSTKLTHNSCIITSLLSDHFPIFYTINKPSPQKEVKFIKYRDFSDENLSSFILNLNSINWTDFFNMDCAQEAYDTFSNNFFTLYDLHFPLITKKLNTNYHKMDPWYTNGLLVSRRKKIKLEKIASSNRSVQNISSYKTYRNLYNKIVRSAKKMYFDKQFALAQSDMKKTWKLIRYAINRKAKSKNNSVDCLLKDNIILQTPLEIANAFNEFFTTAPSKITSKINPVPFEAPSQETPTQTLFSFDDYPISEEEIFNAVSLLSPKKSLDYNNISLFFIKKMY